VGQVKLEPKLWGRSHQPWAQGRDTSTLTRLGSYRFDDPDGEVGMETHLVGTSDGQILQVPLTYRGAPRDSAEHSLVTKMTHTTLGDRWIYDACHDPVYVTALAAAVLTGGQEVNTTHVRGSGSSTVVEVPDLSTFAVRRDETTTRFQAGISITFLHVPTAAPAVGTEGLVLTGTWPGQETPLLLAVIDRAP
jgi:hypothetical protein